MGKRATFINTAHIGDRPLPNVRLPKPPCVFCDIVKSHLAEGFRKEGPGVVSFIPLKPVTPGHRLFVPKVHSNDAGHGPVGAAAAFEDACDWGAQQNEDFNIITSCGANATQTVFHTHIHYVPRRENDGLLLPWSNQHNG